MNVLEDIRFGVDFSVKSFWMHAYIVWMYAISQSI